MAIEKTVQFRELVDKLKMISFDGKAPSSNENNTTKYIKMKANAMGSSYTEVCKYAELVPARKWKRRPGTNHHMKEKDIDFNREWNGTSDLLLQMCIEDKRLHTNGKPSARKIAKCMNRRESQIRKKLGEVLK